MLLVTEYLTGHGTYVVQPMLISHDKTITEGDEFFFSTEEEAATFIRYYQISPFAATYAYKYAMQNGVPIVGELQRAVGEV